MPIPASTRAARIWGRRSSSARSHAVALVGRHVRRECLFVVGEPHPPAGCRSRAETNKAVQRWVGTAGTRPPARVLPPLVAADIANQPSPRGAVHIAAAYLPAHRRSQGAWPRWEARACRAPAESHRAALLHRRSRLLRPARAVRPLAIRMQTAIGAVLAQGSPLWAGARPYSSHEKVLG